MGFIQIGRGSAKKRSRFLHLLDFKNLRIIFSKDEKGVRVEACESKDAPPYVATVKFSFYITEKEYRRIATKHKNIICRMMSQLEGLSETIEDLYKRKRGKGGLGDGSEG